MTIDLTPVLSPTDDLLYRAWVVIANSGEWLTDPDGEWVEAAKAWRDEFHERLGIRDYVISD